MDEIEKIKEFCESWSDESEGAVKAGKPLSEVVAMIVEERHSAYCREYDMRWGLQQRLEKEIGAGRALDEIKALRLEREEKIKAWASRSHLHDGEVSGIGRIVE